VAPNQRERMMVAVAEAVSASGYAGLTVEAIVSRAGVSRRTFYDQFANKDEAFLASYDAVAAQLVAVVKEAFDATTDFVDRVVGCLEAFLVFLANEREFAHMCVVDVLGSGPEGIARRNGVMTLFEGLFDVAAAEASLPPRELVAETVVGGIHEVVYARLLHDRADEIVPLLPDLVYTSLLPYVGPRTAERARRECRHRVPRPVAAAIAGR
jgi:AcrR family transcriptional regulator